MNRRKHPGAATRRTEARTLRLEACRRNSIRLRLELVEKRSKVHHDILANSEELDELTCQEITAQLQRAVQTVTQPILNVINTRKSVDSGRTRILRFGGNAKFLSIPGGDA